MVPYVPTCSTIHNTVDNADNPVGQAMSVNKANVKPLVRPTNCAVLEYVLTPKQKKNIVVNVVSPVLPTKLVVRAPAPISVGMPNTAGLVAKPALGKNVVAMVFAFHSKPIPFTAEPATKNATPRKPVAMEPASIPKKTTNIVVNAKSSVPSNKPALTGSVVAEGSFCAKVNVSTPAPTGIIVAAVTKPAPPTTPVSRANANRPPDVLPAKYCHVVHHPNLHETSRER